MENDNGHLTINEYLKFIEESATPKVIYSHKVIYRKIITKWKTPKDWIQSDDKTIYNNNYASNSYWYNWSLCKGKKLPIDFIKTFNLTKSEKILKAYLEDFNEVETVVMELQVKYKCSIIVGIYSKIMKVCMFLGVRSVKHIAYKNLIEAFVEKILNMDELYFMEKLLRDLGYISISPQKSEEWKNEVRNQKKLSLKTLWGNEMKTAINGFLDNMEMSRINKQMRVAKEGHINLFGSWCIKNMGLILINHFTDLNNELWLKYVSAIIGIDEISDKTKESKLITVIQLFDWMKIKKPNIISNKFMYNRGDFKILDSSINLDNFAFKKRIYAEKILRYLVNDFKPDSLREEYYKEFIIILANSGVRYSELRDMEYESIFFSKDEGMYKMIIKYIDKLGQINRPVYFTRDGYEAVKRVEELRRKYGNLDKQYNKRVKKSFIHLFEFDGINSVKKQYLYEFHMRIKYKLNLIEENGRCVNGNMHSYRHFFGMTVFRLSNYNISVVRYLLGHRSYQMSNKYLEEENSVLFSKIREEKDPKKIAGKGIDTLYDFIYSNISNPIPSSIERYLSSGNTYLIDILECKDIKKVEMGFCLNPCKNANKCFKCRFFLITENEKNELITYLCDLMGIITYKIQKSNKLVDDAINIPSISEDLDDVIVLTEELKKLGVKNDELSSILENGKRG